MIYRVIDIDRVCFADVVVTSEEFFSDQVVANDNEFINIYHILNAM